MTDINTIFLEHIENSVVGGGFAAMHRAGLHSLLIQAAFLAAGESIKRHGHCSVDKLLEGTRKPGRSVRVSLGNYLRFMAGGKWAAKEEIPPLIELIDVVKTTGIRQPELLYDFSPAGKHLWEEIDRLSNNQS